MTTKFRLFTLIYIVLILSSGMEEFYMPFHEKSYSIGKHIDQPTLQMQNNHHLCESKRPTSCLNFIALGYTSYQESLSSKKQSSIFSTNNEALCSIDIEVPVPPPKLTSFTELT